MISFLHPWVLGGLAFAAVPLLLHLIARREPPTVLFPAVRYLVDVTREHQRRLKLRNWLLLLLRTLLIIALVLAAAAPSAPRGTSGGHAPSALVVILDNSPSSGAVVGGTPRLSELKLAARRILEQATPTDALWLVSADGLPRRGDAAELGRLVDSLDVSERRLDVGAAIGIAGEVLASERRPGGIAIVSDVQATAVTPAEVRVPLLLVRPSGAAAPNVGIGSIDPGPQPWTPDGGAVVVALVGDSGPPTPVAVRLGERASRQALGAAGGSVSFPLPGAAAGWWPVTSELNPDEFRLDDRRQSAVRIAPIASVRWDPRDRYLATACAVLETSGRLRQGEEVSLGTLGPGRSVVEPPADPAELGALNRALERRGVSWRFGTLLEAPAVTDSGATVGRETIARRYALEPAPGRAPGDPLGVIATVNGTPWLVRSAGVVLLGSRLNPAWSGLPLSARFVSFVDALVNRVARGQLDLIQGAPGDPVLLPDLVTEVRAGERRWTVEGGAAFRAPARGLYYLTGPAGDTVGVLAVNLDPRESALTPASDETLRRLWRGARIVAPRDAGSAAFAGLARGGLQGPLLWLAVGLAFAEVTLASGWRRRS